MKNIMEIKAFENIDKRVNKLIDFNEKYHIHLNKKSCYVSYPPEVGLYAKDGWKTLSKAQVEIMTGEKYENAMYLSALTDCCIDYATYPDDKREEIKRKMPLAIYCAERIANQCIRNVQAGKKIEFDFKKVSESLFSDLADVSDNGKVGEFKLFRGQEKHMEKIMANPSFLVVLDRELQKSNMTVSGYDFYDKRGEKTSTQGVSKSLSLEVKEKEHIM